MACVYAQWHVFLSREPPKARMRLTSSHAHGILIPHVLSGWRRTGRPPRPGLSARPSSPSCRKRRAHLYTKRRLIPTVSAIWEIDTLSAIRDSKIIKDPREVMG